jgi:hypothetical protein
MPWLVRARAVAKKSWVLFFKPYQFMGFQLKELP